MRASLLLAVIIVCMGPLQAIEELEHVAYSNVNFDLPVITEPSVLVAQFSTGVAEQVTGPQLLLMPNPTDGMLWVQVSEVEHGNGIIRLLAMDGRTVHEQRMTGYRTELDLGMLSTGPYLLEWTGVYGMRVVKPLIRN